MAEVDQNACEFEAPEIGETEQQNETLADVSVVEPEPEKKWTGWPGGSGSKCWFLLRRLEYRNVAYHLTTYVLFDKSKQETKGNKKTETNLNKKDRIHYGFLILKIERKLLHYFAYVFYMNESVVLDNSTLISFPINGLGVSVFQMTRLVNKIVDCDVAKNIARNCHEHRRLEFGLVILVRSSSATPSSIHGSL
ncbi:hypothetical protein RYX36_025879 [Vicia faba]